jgi:hypothetical protein
VGLSAALLLAVIAPSAMAITRDEYKAQVEPICKTNSEENKAILKGVEKQVKQDKLKPAGTKLIKASGALKKAHTQLSAVEQPVEDAAKLTKWLGYIKDQVNLLKSTGTALKAGNKKKAQKERNKLDTAVKQANSQVLAFSFRYCKIDPTQYT